ncbi:hypothetical protein FRB99_008525 [Tulasnella sp. 403]|nr:hypothetical protein FRB99_008525 [Tulasnella sp. 403]
MASPRWFTPLKDTLSKYPKSTIYTLATVDALVSPPIPHVRSIVHREFLTPTADLPLLVSTTDIRTPKVHEITSISNLDRPNAEIVWWIQDSSEQYRFLGIMHLLPHPNHPLASTFPGQKLAPKVDENGKPFDWEQERVRVFDEKMGPALRAGFARPTPGSKLNSYDDAKAWPTALPKHTEVAEDDSKTRAQVDEALSNFALMVLEPLVVERVELGIVPNRRTKYERVVADWQETIVVP